MGDRQITEHEIIVSQLTQIRMLRTALEPFAKAAASVDLGPDDLDDSSAWEHAVTFGLKLGDFKGAAEVAGKIKLKGTP